MCVPLLESGRFGILEDSFFLIGCICECFAETCSSSILCMIRKQSRKTASFTPENSLIMIADSLFMRANRA